MINLFDSTDEQGSRFLQALGKEIDLREFELLGMEGGFTSPNEYLSIEAIIRVLRDHEFPNENFYEYEWAIYECGFDRLREYSACMQTFLSSMYVYCNKRKRWGLLIESDYFYLVIPLALDSKNQHELVPLYIAFIEWLFDQVEPDAGYDDYYCLLTWALLRRLSGSTNHPCYRQVVDLLLGKKYSRDDIEQLTVSDRGIEAWFDLHQRITCPEPLKKDFELIIRGVPA